MKLVLIIFSF